MRCPDDLFFRTTCSGGPTDDRSRRRCFCFYVLVCDDFFLELDELTSFSNFDPLGTLYEVLPPLFCRFFLGFSGLVAFLLLLFLPLGGVGSPCRVFPAFSPCFSGGWGVRFVFSALHSCILRLLCRSRLGQPGVRARKPPGPHRACTLLVPPDPSPAGSRRGDVQSTSAVG